MVTASALIEPFPRRWALLVAALVYYLAVKAWGWKRAFTFGDPLMRADMEREMRGGTA